MMSDKDWQWWSGTNDEYYTNGPFQCREHAVEELDGEGGYIIEAVKLHVRFNADQLIENQYFEDDDYFSGENSDPDRAGSVAIIKTANAELQGLLDAWCNKWQHTFVAPEMFAATRNAAIVPEFADEAAQEAWLAENPA
ncbi:hypothetical protein ACGGKE_07805 [Sphingobium naphthae]|uniref:hypothetical protein n=1 Tax=Sphingobium naphthae TaxID=1886786 RepID=UPI0037491B98